MTGRPSAARSRLMTISEVADRLGISERHARQRRGIWGAAMTDRCGWCDDDGTPVGRRFSSEEGR